MTLSCLFRIASVCSLSIFAFGAPLYGQTAAPTKPAAPSGNAARETIDVLEAQKLKDAIGKEVTATGHVVGVGLDAKSGNVFLNFSRDRDSGFVVMIKGSAAKAAGVDLKEKYNGKDVAVTGVLSLFKNKTEIVVQSLEQIEIK